MTGPRIALIHATTAAIAPAMDGLAAGFPEAEPWNLLDDRLLPDADAAGGLTAELSERMSGLIEYACGAGAAGVLLTCSMYGPVATAAVGVPVLAPDEGAFERVVREHWGGVLVVASFDTAGRDAAARLRTVLDEAGSETRVASVTATAAVGPSRTGDAGAIAHACFDAIAPVGGHDAVVLAQYSLAPAAERLEARLGLPVVSGPRAAAALLKARLTERPR